MVRGWWCPAPHLRGRGRRDPSIGGVVVLGLVWLLHWTCVWWRRKEKLVRVCMYRSLACISLAQPTLKGSG